MENNGGSTCVLFILFFLSLVHAGQGEDDIPYDSSATTQCLAEPWKPHYGGGILKNPEFDTGVSGWTVFGHGAIESRASSTGNRFIVARNRTQPLDSFAQKVQLVGGNFYSFSAWVQISEGSESVSSVFRTRERKLVRGGTTIARNGCWSLIKGGIAANSTGLADLLFESNNPTVEIWVDNVSLQPFTKKQWRSHQEQNIAKVRKSRVRFQVTHSNKTVLPGAAVSVSPIRTSFPFGCGMNHYIVENEDYRNWFASRFSYTTFTNEMKWYSTEKKQGHENYTVADEMVKFAKSHNISIRGHNIFWADPKYQPDWVPGLSSEELAVAADKRINSVVSRYAGELIHWDWMNENLHFRFYEDKLGENASSMYFSIAHRLDPKPIIFMNEYSTIEHSDDTVVGPVNYMKRIQEIQSFPGNEGLTMGIGLQGHFGSGQPNLAYMRASIDTLATTGLPIWLTEVDVERDPNQAEYLEDVLREGYSHPAVQGIIMFAGPAAAGFNVTILADPNFSSTAAGDVVDKLIDEWRSSALEAKTDDKGFFEISLFNGEYEVAVTHPQYSNNFASSRIEVTKNDDAIERAFYLRID